MNNIMLDLECLNSCTTATIISIGAVYFDVRKQVLGEELYIELSQEALQEQLSLGRTWSLSTMVWWTAQSTEARKVWQNNDIKTTNKEACSQIKDYFNAYVDNGRNINVWGNGSTYDNVCLQSYLKTFKQRIPWNYKGDMCYRTVKHLFGNKAKLVRVEPHHNGLADAKTQANHLMAMLKHSHADKNLDK